MSRWIDNEMVFLGKKHGLQIREEKNSKVRYLSGEDAIKIVRNRWITKHKGSVPLPKLIISN